MIFAAPISFDEAAEHGAVKVILPTALKSAEAKEHLSAEVLERSRWSSQIVNAELLDDLDQEIENRVQGETNLATARNFLRAKARSYRYQPQPGKEGTIEDFTSNARLNLTLRTNVQMAQGYGQFIQGQDPVVLDLYPAQELYRGQKRKKPRNWVARWGQAAKATHTKVSGFVALKNTPIWVAISAFGNPYWPYDYGSGMRTRDKSRAEAMADGLIDRDTQIRPESRGFNQDLAFSPAIRSQQLRQAIVEGSNGQLYYDGTGTLRLRATPAAGNEADEDEPTASDVARAVVESYDPADPETWDVGDDERETLSPDEVEKLALERYLEALFNGDATALQTAGNATPHHSGKQMRCPKGTVRGGRFCRSVAECGGVSSSAILKQHPSLRGLGKVLRVDHGSSPTIAGHVADLGKVPAALHAKVVKAGLKEVHFGQGAVPDLDDLSALKGVEPRGWHGQTWDDVPAAFDPNKGVVVAGNRGAHGSVSAALHEYGHAVGAYLGHDNSPQLVALHHAMYTHLDPYLQQDGPGGVAGRQELFAEGFAHVVKDPLSAETKYGKQWVEFIQKDVLSIKP